ncbi:MAG: SDR family NAD(P)-dependent oxidoreductase [Terriglobia bacterium]
MADRLMWRDKVVLVTGASQGIGASLARLLAAEGAKLSLTALASTEFCDRESPSTLVTAGDITSDETRRRVVERTLGKFGRIDVLINNAGVGQYGYPSEADSEVSKRLFDVNVFSVLALTQLVIPGMRARKSGVIVNIGSVGGEVSLPWAVMYCASKWALHCLDDSFRRELAGSGIRVVKVCPGIVDTEFRSHVLAGKAPQNVENIRRMVSPDRVAATIISGVKRNKKRLYVPAIGRVFTSLEFFAPWLMDWYVRRKF